MKRRNLWFILIALIIVFGLIVWVLVSDFELLSSSDRIAVVEVRGTIAKSQDTVKSLKELRQDESVKAIVLRVESPGGGVGASQEIYREVRRTRDAKPIVASLGGIAASGGYYVSSPANRIVANPGTITGSIGVIVYFPRLQGLFDKIGYGMTTIKSGEFKDIGNPTREMTDEERQLLQSTVEETHNQFIRDVAEGRNLPEEKIREWADGRILMGQAAHRLGLVDELGNFEDAVRIAANLAGITGEPELIYPTRKRRSLLELLLGTELSERVDVLLGGPAGFLRYQLPIYP
ncbi:MAG: signal peptide peptidase SppA [Syntrophobacteraceae bacterium]|nr:signal peptide peptidase SppA [Syntrophobacteraceae bacterium]